MIIFKFEPHQFYYAIDCSDCKLAFPMYKNPKSRYITWLIIFFVDSQSATFCKNELTIHDDPSIIFSFLAPIKILLGRCVRQHHINYKYLRLTMSIIIQRTRYVHLTTATYSRTYLYDCRLTYGQQCFNYLNIVLRLYH